MTEREAYIAFNLTEHVGSVTVEGLVAKFGSVVEAWQTYPKKISRTGGEVDWQSELARAGKFGVTILTPADEDYPRQLSVLSGAPLALYVKGETKVLSKPSIAMVGTRRSTVYGREIANRLAYDLAKAGWGVVSGLATGIDAESHRGALRAEGLTIGVIGSGLDRFYPEENRELAREIVQKGGAVVSQFPFGHPPDRETFPIRNHVVAALARGVVAVEAPIRSGTLITTGIAADLGRTVMAVPARIDSRMSAGCLQLIREGAILVRHADDVLEAMNELLPRDRKSPDAGTETRDTEQPPYSAEEALVMLHVDEVGVPIEDIVHRTKLPLARVNSLVLELRLKGFLRFLPGNRVACARDML